jgi:diguanylate cyclase (GGDEF)-like protein
MSLWSQRSLSAVLGCYAGCLKKCSRTTSIRLSLSRSFGKTHYLTRAFLQQSLTLRPPTIFDGAISYPTSSLGSLRTGLPVPANLPPYFCERTLKQLLAFGLHANEDMPLGDELRASLISDGFNMSPGPEVDSSIPAELAQLPGKKNLVSDLQRKLDADELVSVLYMDMDGFKPVNDTMGHTEGDNCLIRIAGVMTKTILGKGKLYRPGGDELVAVLPNFNQGEAVSTAERIRAAIDGDNPGGTLKVTVSIGVVSSEFGVSTAEDLIEVADKAMYAAKRAKNSVAVADPS